MLVATPALAKPINLPLPDNEQAALIELLEIATKACGLTCAQNAVYFSQKIKTFRDAADREPMPAPIAPVEPPK
jgi:hypothetical protein